MIVEKIAAKKTLAVTLALALGLSLPGGAWAQVIGARVSPVSAAGAESAASFAGAQTISLAMPALSISAVAGAPTLAAPAPVPSAAPAAAAAAMAAPAPAIAMPGAVEAHPVIGLINRSRRPASLSTARAPAPTPRRSRPPLRPCPRAPRPARSSPSSRR